MKIRRRTFIRGAVGGAIATSLFPGYAARAQDQPGAAGAQANGLTGHKPKPTPLSAEDAKSLGKVTLLFVQNAQGVTLDNGKLTLKGIAPTTIFFSDRPERIAGHLVTKEFVPFWSEGKDSFAANPPNATLSVFGDGKISDIVVELSHPQLSGDELAYNIRVLEGDMPAQGGVCSLFIDVIGMPLTPMSYAGAARRAYRWR
jgi:hypothetical protein